MSLSIVPQAFIGAIVNKDLSKHTFYIQEAMPKNPTALKHGTFWTSLWAVKLTMANMGLLKKGNTFSFLV